MSTTPTTPHDDTYGTTDYRPPVAPPGYSLTYVSEPPEPNGWHGTYRVAMGRLIDAEDDRAWAVWHVRPNGALVDGIYDLEAHHADDIAARRAWAEHSRALPVSEQGRARP